jgi:hypothetical protein
MTYAWSPDKVSDIRYPQAEFEFIFKDRSGKPVEGIELCVEDQAGRRYYHYPVTDYLPDKVPTSNRDGVLVFHHVSELFDSGCRTTYLFDLIPLGERGVPVFICRFLHKDHEIYRIRFRDVYSDFAKGEHLDVVRQHWSWPVWKESQGLLKPYAVGEDWDGRRLRLFDLNKNGRLEPEEAAAWSAATSSRAERVAIAQLVGEDIQEDLEFIVIRKTILLETEITSD